ncbi:UNKNOWN [Stylonychia lemnae]|uniref:Uncharacterized protein n=1 Tax=Stylonychia lemnae TaxID=5949 RepID=A0A078AZ83_STYLE|nr:UNKNOWN [Stylonychia lemnae]|eukprot:CDW87454.1 UNKNOWN [Stylonychia lemnae]
MESNNGNETPGGETPTPTGGSTITPRDLITIDIQELETLRDVITYKAQVLRLQERTFKTKQKEQQAAKRALIDFLITLFGYLSLEEAQNLIAKVCKEYNFKLDQMILQSIEKTNDIRDKELQRKHKFKEHQSQAQHQQNSIIESSVIVDKADDFDYMMPQNYSYYHEHKPSGDENNATVIVDRLIHEQNELRKSYAVDNNLILMGQGQADSRPLMQKLGDVQNKIKTIMESIQQDLQKVEPSSNKKLDNQLRQSNDSSQLGNLIRYSMSRSKKDDSIRLSVSKKNSLNNTILMHDKRDQFCEMIKAVQDQLGKILYEEFNYISEYNEPKLHLDTQGIFEERLQPQAFEAHTARNQGYQYNMDHLYEDKNMSKNNSSRKIDSNAMVSKSLQNIRQLNPLLKSLENKWMSQASSLCKLEEQDFEHSSDDKQVMGDLDEDQVNMMDDMEIDNDHQPNTVEDNDDDNQLDRKKQRSSPSYNFFDRYQEEQVLSKSRDMNNESKEFSIKVRNEHNEEILVDFGVDKIEDKEGEEIVAGINDDVDQFRKHRDIFTESIQIYRKKGSRDYNQNNILVQDAFEFEELHNVAYEMIDKEVQVCFDKNDQEVQYVAQYKEDIGLQTEDYHSIFSENIIQTFDIYQSECNNKRRLLDADIQTDMSQSSLSLYDKLMIKYSDQSSNIITSKVVELEVINNCPKVIRQDIDVQTERQDKKVKKLARQNIVQKQGINFKIDLGSNKFFVKSSKAVKSQDIVSGLIEILSLKFEEYFEQNDNQSNDINVIDNGDLDQDQFALDYQIFKFDLPNRQNVCNYSSEIQFDIKQAKNDQILDIPATILEYSIVQTPKNINLVKEFQFDIQSTQIKKTLEQQNHVQENSIIKCQSVDNLIQQNITLQGIPIQTVLQSLKTLDITTERMNIQICQSNSQRQKLQEVISLNELCVCPQVFTLDTLKNQAKKKHKKHKNKNKKTLLQTLLEPKAIDEDLSIQNLLVDAQIIRVLPQYTLLPELKLDSILQIEIRAEQNAQVQVIQHQLQQQPQPYIIKGKSNGRQKVMSENRVLQKGSAEDYMKYFFENVLDVQILPIMFSNSPRGTSAIQTEKVFQIECIKMAPQLQELHTQYQDTSIQNICMNLQILNQSQNHSSKDNQTQTSLEADIINELTITQFDLVLELSIIKQVKDQSRELQIQSQILEECIIASLNICQDQEIQCDPQLQAKIEQSISEIQITKQALRLDSQLESVTQVSVFQSKNQQVDKLTFARIEFDEVQIIKIPSQFQQEIIQVCQILVPPKENLTHKESTIELDTCVIGLSLCQTTQIQEDLLKVNSKIDFQKAFNYEIIAQKNTEKEQKILVQTQFDLIHLTKLSSDKQLMFDNLSLDSCKINKANHKQKDLENELIFEKIELYTLGDKQKISLDINLHCISSQILLQPKQLEIQKFELEINKVVDHQESNQCYSLMNLEPIWIINQLQNNCDQRDEALQTYDLKLNLEPVIKPQYLRVTTMDSDTQYDTQDESAYFRGNSTFKQHDSYLEAPKQDQSNQNEIKVGLMTQDQACDVIEELSHREMKDMIIEQHNQVKQEIAQELQQFTEMVFELRKSVCDQGLQKRIKTKEQGTCTSDVQQQLHPPDFKQSIKNLYLQTVLNQTNLSLTEIIQRKSKEAILSHFKKPGSLFVRLNYEYVLQNQKAVLGKPQPRIRGISHNESDNEASQEIIPAQLRRYMAYKRERSYAVLCHNGYVFIDGLNNNIDIFTVDDFRFVQTVNSDEQNLICAFNVKDRYYFGCQNRCLIICDDQFNRITKVSLSYNAYDIIQLNKQCIMLGERRGFIEVFDVVENKIIYSQKLENVRHIIQLKQLDYCDDICVAADNGLFFIQMNYCSENESYMATKLDESYFDDRHIRGVISLDRTQPRQLAVSLDDDKLLYLVNRETRQITKSIIGGPNAGPVCIRRHISQKGDSNFILIRDENGINLVDIETNQFKQIIQSINLMAPFPQQQMEIIERYDLEPGLLQIIIIEYDGRQSILKRFELNENYLDAVFVVDFSQL